MAVTACQPGRVDEEKSNNHLHTVSSVCCTVSVGTFSSNIDCPDSFCGMVIVADEES